MFASFKLKAAARKRKRLLSATIDVCRQLMMAPPMYSETVTRGLKIDAWDIADSCAPSMMLIRTRQTRGDLVELTYSAESYLKDSKRRTKYLISYVDQSFAYKGLLGVNDIRMPNTSRLEFLYTILANHLAQVKETT